MRALFASVLLAGLGIAAAPVHAAESVPPPILLVHGLVWEVEGNDRTWGWLEEKADEKASSRFGGMIGFLEGRGYGFGGTIRPRCGQVRLPGDLVNVPEGLAPGCARVFVLQFSAAANTDGLAYKALELAAAIAELRRYTGAEKVRLVTHSAGGIVARTYLQSALPGVAYRGDVDRLITIATPHLGSPLAAQFGDFLGTRATSLKPQAALIRALDDELDLPDDVRFAAIVVRGVAADVRGDGAKHDHLVDQQFFAALPVEYRLGGDQVVHVKSQNLRLARCAARYEARTGRPVQYVMARVPDPSPSDWPWQGATVHVAATADPTVEHLVAGLVSDGALLWQACDAARLAEWRDWQARVHADGVIEAETLIAHRMSEVSNVELNAMDLVGDDGDVVRYAFAGKAFSENMLVPFRHRWTPVEGKLGLTFDRFGRVLAADWQVN